jgi:hypothetical protein
MTTIAKFPLALTAMVALALSACSGHEKTRSGARTPSVSPAVRAPW